MKLKEAMGSFYTTVDDTDYSDYASPAGVLEMLDDLEDAINDIAVAAAPPAGSLEGNWKVTARARKLLQLMRNHLERLKDA